MDEKPLIVPPSKGWTPPDHVLPPPPTVLRPPQPKRRRHGVLKVLLVLILALGGSAAYEQWHHSSADAPEHTYGSSHSAKIKYGPAITWITPYKDLGDLHLLSGTFNTQKYFHYYQVGTTADHKQVILAASSNQSSAVALNSNFTDIGYFVGASPKYQFLKTAVSDMYKTQDVDNSTASLKFAPNVQVTSTYALADLQPNDQVTLDNADKTQLEKTSSNIYADLGFPVDHTGLSRVNAAQGTVGTVYAETPKVASSQYSTPDYLLYRPDLRVVTYRVKLTLPFKNGVPQITWNDGSKNTAKYVQNQPPSCGQSAGDVVGSYVTASSLTPIGKDSTGAPVYGFKSAYTSLQYAYYTADNAQRYNGKLTATKFLSDKYVIVYKNSLGQYTMLVNASSPLTSC